ncbi:MULTISPECIES: apolipoprotein N-acyltransferase [Cobetia]|uniref:Apolipoprotein N-acyltransferase n=1 Tax=Cobetia crustatorum TaxID=553385 RepID=A0A558HDZ7_9GAMM|nr:MULTISPECIES: apolipoprotein N-acyltransferase [Cobetia]TVU67355.1 apolipoprotein N-acyltransferase [Cobetia crustatorum]
MSDSPRPAAFTGISILGHVLAIIAGGLVTLSFAPFDQWWLGPLGAGLLYGTLRMEGGGFMRAWWYGVGLFGSGASWVYVSIHDYGYTGMPLAVLLTMLFVACMALFPALWMGLWQRFCSRRFDVLSFAAMFVISELFRTWAFTGFPWLLLGNSAADSPLAHWVPILGVYGISLIIALSGALLWNLALRRRWLAIAPLVVLWGAGLLLPANWTQPGGQPARVALLQGNLPQLIKWSAEGQRRAANTYAAMTRAVQDDADLIVWPETALPMLRDQAEPFLERIQATLPPKTGLITGIVERDADGRFYNSVIPIDAPGTQYRKEHLVPFGEYVPLENVLRGVISFLDLPMSSMAAGGSDQPPLSVSGLRIGVAICYEIVYPELVRQRALSSTVLLTVSNDTWFGHSIGPLQHLQMAQMRALENGRYLLRATSNGVTAIISPQGEILEQAPQFEEATVTGDIRLQLGMTPWMRFGMLPVWILIALLLAPGLVLGITERIGARRQVRRSS